MQANNDDDVSVSLLFSLFLSRSHSLFHSAMLLLPFIICLLVFASRFCRRASTFHSWTSRVTNNERNCIYFATWNVSCRRINQSIQSHICNGIVHFNGLSLLANGLCVCVCGWVNNMVSCAVYKLINKLVPSIKITNLKCCK